MATRSYITWSRLVKFTATHFEVRQTELCLRQWFQRLVSSCGSPRMVPLVNCPQCNPYSCTVWILLITKSFRFSRILSSIVSCRIILNIRKYGNKPLISNTNVIDGITGMEPTSGLHFATHRDLGRDTGAEQGLYWLLLLVTAGTINGIVVFFFSGDWCLYYILNWHELICDATWLPSTSKHN